MSLPPEVQTLLLSALTALATGATAGLGFNRRQLRRLRNAQRALRRQVKALGELTARVERVERGGVRAERRAAWHVGALRALLAHAGLRAPRHFVALDAEATSPRGPAGSP